MTQGTHRCVKKYNGKADFKEWRRPGWVCGVPPGTRTRLKYHHLRNLGGSDSHVAPLCKLFPLFIIILPLNSRVYGRGDGILCHRLYGAHTKYVFFLLKLLHRAYKMLWYYYGEKKNGSVPSQQKWIVNISSYLCLLSTFFLKDSNHFKHISVPKTSVNNLTSTQLLLPNFTGGKCY